MDDLILYELSEFIASLEFSALPEKVVEAAKLRILDYFAASSAGYRINKFFGDAFYKVISSFGGVKESAVMFYEGSFPACNAAMINGLIAHGADMDDGNKAAQGHPGACLIPAVFALAEPNESSGKDIITAIVAGYEIFVRFGSVINPHHALMGFHSTGTVGTIAAAAAAAKLLKLSAEKTAHAIGFACMQAAGLLEVVENGQQSKPLNCAKAASNGVLSALLAQEGLAGPRTILTGRKGFLNAFAGENDLLPLTSGLGETFAITNCYLKQYPSCRHTHGIIDLVLSLRKEHAFSIEKIKAIKVRLYKLGISVTGNIIFPKSSDEAKFSSKYALAVALIKGRYSFAELNAANGTIDAQVINLINKIEMICDDTLENKEAGIRGTKLEIVMDDGMVLSEKLKYPKGEGEYPLGFDEIRRKMETCADGVLKLEIQRKIFEVIQEFENAACGSTVMKLLCACNTES